MRVLPDGMVQLDAEAVSSNLIKSACTIAAPRSLVYQNMAGSSSVIAVDSACGFNNCCWCAGSELQVTDPPIVMAAGANGARALRGLVALRTL